MEKHVALTNSANNRDDLERALHLLRSLRATDGTEGSPDAPTGDVVYLARYRSGHSADAGELRRDYEFLCKRLEQWLAEFHDLGVIVQGTNPDRLNPMRESGWDTLIARLVLTFPDVAWWFVPTEADAQADWVDDLGVGQAFHPTPPPLFDPYGLRDRVRAHAQSHGVRDKHPGIAAYLPRRTEWAVALDEERAYCYLHAYTTYRFGYRSAAVTSAAVADRLLKFPERRRATISFEDLFLNFADGRQGLSCIPLRDRHWRLLRHTSNRVFVTSGQRLPADEAKQELNRRWICKLVQLGRVVRFVHKPHAGIFQLWGQSKLKVAEDFVWPPQPGAITPELVDEHGHSSPGALMTVAARLLTRAVDLLPAANAVSVAVRGAVMANDALELLGGRTPTLSAYALRLKHQFESIAECHFLGVEHHVDVDERLLEIERDTRLISHWFDGAKQSSAALNIEMDIVNRLILVFREHGQFDEEHKCLIRARKLQSTLWMRDRTRWWSPMKRLFCVPIRYTEWLLIHPTHFLIALPGWVLALAGLFWWTDETRAVDWRVQLLESIEHAIVAFFAGGTPILHSRELAEVHGSGQLAVICLALVSGVFHLGVFISHLYTLVVRR